MKSLLTLTAVALVASYTTASAATIELKPYVGAELGYMKTHSQRVRFNMNDQIKLNIGNFFDDQQFTGALIAGARLSKNFGIEAFLQRGKEDSKNVNIPQIMQNFGADAPEGIPGALLNGSKIKTTSQLDYAWGLDFNGYLPLTEKVELVGTVGLGSYNFTHGISGVFFGTPLTNTLSINQKEENVFGLRLALGVDYKINDKWSARANFRYVRLDPSALEWTDNLKEVTLGLRYSF